jgi:hypothetical protein
MWRTRPALPRRLGRRRREGVVVRYGKESESGWVGNFLPGLSGATSVRLHPDGTRVLVLAKGDCWAVDSAQRSTELVSQ